MNGSDKNSRWGKGSIPASLVGRELLHVLSSIRVRKEIDVTLEREWRFLGNQLDVVHQILHKSAFAHGNY